MTTESFRWRLSSATSQHKTRSTLSVMSDPLTKHTSAILEYNGDAHETRWGVTDHVILRFCKCRRNCQFMSVCSPNVSHMTYNVEAALYMICGDTQTESMKWSTSNRLWAVTCVAMVCTGRVTECRRYPIYLEMDIKYETNFSGVNWW